MIFEFNDAQILFGMFQGFKKVTPLGGAKKLRLTPPPVLRVRQIWRFFLSKIAPKAYQRGIHESYQHMMKIFVHESQESHKKKKIEPIEHKCQHNDSVNASEKTESK